MQTQQAQPSGTGMRTVIIMSVVTLGGLLLCATSFGELFNYARFIWGLFLLWPGLIWLRILKDVLVARVRPDWAARDDAWRRLPFNIATALAPGQSLIWYGLAAPANPTLTRGGFDVCELAVGYCVSGTRAMAWFGGFALLIGLVVVSLMVRTAKEAGKSA
jgi:hypothetical protein